MLGNDVVDLQQADLESNWQRRGYLNKILSVLEQKSQSESACPNSMFWLLWTMKEAAYKVFNRSTGERSFDPKSLKCKVDTFDGNSATGRVTLRNAVYHTTSQLDDQRIHTVAMQEIGGLSGLEIYNLSNHGNYLSSFNRDSKKYHLMKNELGLPLLQNLQTGQLQFASISHHGRYLTIVTQPIDLEFFTFPF